MSVETDSDGWKESERDASNHVFQKGSQLDEAEVCQTRK
jgi:hypothetical protein